MTEPRYWAIVPAAGVGKRLQAAVPGAPPKQYLAIGGRAVLAHTLERLDSIGGLAAIVVALGAHDTWFSQLDLALRTPLEIVQGGAERADSVMNALRAIEDRAQPDDWVLVHDAVRPCVGAGDIERLRRELAADVVGGLLAVPVRETLKKGTAGNRVACTVPREQYWLAATPQMFRYGVLSQALAQAIADQVVITDEAHAVERAGHPVRLVPGRADNIKITHPEDLVLAEHILTAREDG